MAAKAGKNLTVFGQETEFDGVLEFTDSLVITGKFHGTINATGDLEIEKSAVCDVDKILADSVIISGQVKGDIEAKNHIELCSGSNVKGDLKAVKLRISDNVEFEGQVSMIDAVPEKDFFSTASEEFKNSLIMRTNEAH
ncbi:MAG: polymer-forming cytoskeletal protein [Treponema sp.]|nr:polymer-forming cytoskeletal protein [Treponema sp.]